MTTNEAKTYLALNDNYTLDDIEDKYEKLCFDVKNDVLNKPLLIQLLDSKINRLNVVHKAYCTLKEIPFEEIISEALQIDFDQACLELNNEDRKISELIPKYDQVLARQKTILSQCENALQLIKAIGKLIRVQKCYEVIMNKMTKDFSINDNLSPVKISEITATISLDKSFKTLISVYGVRDDLIAINHWFLETDYKKEKKNELLAPLFRELIRIKKLYDRKQL